MLKSEEFRKQILDLKIGILIVIIMLLFFIFVFIGAVDRAIENQDRMLCESAKVSGNVQYLQKCECYYQGGDIKCLQK